MGRRTAILALGVSGVLSRVVTCETWYVSGSVTPSGDGTTWETAFETIQ